MESISCSEILTDSYNLLQDFFTALDNYDTKAIKIIINSKEKDTHQKMSVSLMLDSKTPNTKLIS